MKAVFGVALEEDCPTEELEKVAALRRAERDIVGAIENPDSVGQGDSRLRPEVLPDRDAPWTGGPAGLRGSRPPSCAAARR